MTDNIVSVAAALIRDDSGRVLLVRKRGAAQGIIRFDRGRWVRRPRAGV